MRAREISLGTIIIVMLNDIIRNKIPCYRGLKEALEHLALFLSAFQMVQDVDSTSFGRSFVCSTS